MPRNIFLIGPMGVGKTTIGRQLAGMLGMDFADSDQEIEKRTGVSISTIFDIEGEAGFRRRESAMIEELSALPHTVLATGGGAVLAEENRRILRKRGHVVYLHASIDAQVERTRSSRNRPLLENADDRRARLEELMNIREPLYRQEADLVVDTEGRSASKVAREIADHFSGNP
jgi:shikimate kinase